MRINRAVLVLIWAAALAGQAPAARADEITVLCSNGIKAVVEDLAPKFEAATGHRVIVKYGLAALLKQRIEGGEAFDAAVLTPAAIDDLAARGTIAAGSRTTLARTGLAIAVRAGAPKQDVSTVEALKRALLDARGIAYAKEGASGVAFAAIIRRLGIAEALEPKSRLTATGEEVGQSVIRGDTEFGILPVSEILPVKGVEVLGRFPAEIQSYIVMVGGVAAASRHQAAAKAFLASLAAPAAYPVLEAKGMEPVR